MDRGVYEAPAGPGRVERFGARAAVEGHCQRSHRPPLAGGSGEALPRLPLPRRGSGLG
jgi:hypothetical protein